MQVIVNRAAMLEVLGVAAGVVASRTPKDILKCVRLSTVGDELLISATDLEVAMRARIRQVENRQMGELLVPADKLMQIMRESADETLSIEGDAEGSHVRGQDSHFEIYGQDPREFPPVPDLEGEADVEVEPAVLARLIEQSAFSVAKENTRYAIKGVLWEKKGQKLCLVATDGRRLAKAVDQAARTSGEDARMIVPAKTVQILQRMMPFAEGNVQVRFANNQVLARCGNFVVSSALVEGHFPEYEDVIPKDNDKSVDLNTDSFASAVRRAALLANDQSKGIRLHFAENQLILSSRAPEQGEATVSMSIAYTGEPVDIGFNPVFLSDALKVAGVPQVVLELKDANRPGLLRAGSGFLYVVMPVSLG